MARTMETVKIAASEAAEVSCTMQYLRADLAKAAAALRKRDSGTWYECRDEILLNARVLAREGDALLEGEAPERKDD